MTPNHTRRVLVLDGQTNQALACVRSLGRAGHQVFVASRQQWPLAAWSRYCRGRLHHAGETLEGFARLRDEAWAQRIDIVLPVTERTCHLCSLEHDAWAAAGIIVGCASQELLDQAFDKARTMECAVSNGVRIPRTVVLVSLADVDRVAGEFANGCIVKARSSHTWSGTGFISDPGPIYVADPASLRSAVLAVKRNGPWPLVQELVPGRGKGVFALYDRGTAVAWFAHERLRDVRPSGAGSSLRRSVALDARLCAPAERLLNAMRWHGPAMVEFRDDGASPPVLMEVNGRFWGSLQLAISAGVDFPRLWVDILSGLRPERVDRYADVTLRWLWGDVKRLLTVAAGRPPGYRGHFPSLRQGFTEVFGRQPPGTQLETWDTDDPWPAVGEWAQGVRELRSRGAARRAARKAARHATRFATAEVQPTRLPLP